MIFRVRRASWWSRAAVLFAAAWTAVALGAPLAAPALMARAALAPVAAMHGAAMPHGAMAGHTATCAEGMSAPHDGHRRDDHRCCTCFGPCCHAAPATVASPPAALVAMGVVLAPRPTASAVRVSSYRPTAPEHARPPSVGPPVGSSA